MLVDRWPVPSKVTVWTVCHEASGRAILVELSRVQTALGEPLVALMVRVLPLKVALERPGLLPPVATTRFNWPPLTWSEAMVPPARPPPVTVTEEGAVPITVPPPLEIRVYVPAARAEPVFRTVAGVPDPRVRLPLVRVKDAVPDP